jgi:hypothetical protein
MIKVSIDVITNITPPTKSACAILEVNASLAVEIINFDSCGLATLWAAM